jgi:hypothetical protein
MFHQETNETFRESAARLLPVLLEARAELYALFADITMPEEVHRNAKEAKELIAAIVELLPA